MIEARIIADSVNPCGNRLTTFVCKYNRYIHSELLTHRDKSRNSASSRAIPVRKMLSDIVHEAAFPVYWAKNQSGMQATQQLSPAQQWLASLIWKASSLTQVGYAWLLHKIGTHKQIANRLVEPFAHMTVVLSGTEWGNMFNLRVHPDAQQEFQALSYAMVEAYRDSKPKLLQPGEWHLPFADKYLTEGLSTEQLLKITTARCARVSYLNFEGDISFQKDCDLHDRLLMEGHMSCFEHAAMATDNGDWSGNFRGFTQYRKLIPGENRTIMDIDAILARKPEWLAS